MKVFVTGATGYVGSTVVPELIKNGHEVLGLARSDASAERVRNMGGELFEGDLSQLDRLAEGAAESDAVIHLGFNHDFSRFEQSCAEDVEVVRAIGTALKGSDRLFLVTSGVGVLAGSGDYFEETSKAPNGEHAHPRVQTEHACAKIAQDGVNVSVVRLPPSVHGEGDRGFVHFTAEFARQKGVSAYVGDGENRWPAVHRNDAARLYRLALERGESGVNYHPVAEEGVPFRTIAEALGESLGLPTVGLSGSDAEAHFEWFTFLASLDAPAGSVWTREVLDWQPSGPTLLEDIANGAYAA